MPTKAKTVDDSKNPVHQKASIGITSFASLTKDIPDSTILFTNDGERFPSMDRSSSGKTMRKAPDPNELFEIVDLPNGKKFARIREGLGYADGATATWVRTVHRSLSREIEFEVANALGSKNAISVESVTARSKILGTLATKDQVKDLLDAAGKQTAKTVATGILQSVLPKYNEEVIERMSRAPSYERKGKRSLRRKQM